jgi:hypothetical protein
MNYRPVGAISRGNTPCAPCSMHQTHTRIMHVQRPCEAMHATYIGLWTVGECMRSVCNGSCLPLPCNAFCKGSDECVLCVRPAYIQVPETPVANKPLTKVTTFTPRLVYVRRHSACHTELGG